MTYNPLDIRTHPLWDPRFGFASEAVKRLFRKADSVRERMETAIGDRRHILARQCEQAYTKAMSAFNRDWGAWEQLCLNCGFTEIGLAHKPDPMPNEFTLSH